MTATGTEARVCQDIAERQAKGIAKYGTTVEGNPLGLLQWYKHHYEELLDAAVYVKRIIELVEGVKNDGDKEVAAVKTLELMGYAHLGGVVWKPPLGPRRDQDVQSTTLEDGSTLTATGPVQSDPHAELRKTWKPGQRWQGRLVDYRPGRSGPWVELAHGEPEWRPGTEYRRHPDDKDPPATEKPWIDWGGGLPPVDRNAKVEVRLRDGLTENGTAGDFEWDRANASSDIVAYRRTE